MMATLLNLEYEQKPFQPFRHKRSAHTFRYMYTDALKNYSSLFTGGWGGHAAAYWLRHYATSWDVAGSIPDEVNF
jgi:hypothetical protein